MPDQEGEVIGPLVGLHNRSGVEASIMALSCEWNGLSSRMMDYSRTYLAPPAHAPLGVALELVSCLPRIEGGMPPQML